MKCLALVLSLLAAGSSAFAQTTPPQTVDLSIASITGTPDGPGTVRIDVEVGVGYNDLTAISSATLDLIVDGNPVGSDLVPVGVSNLLPCIQQVDHPTCDASCVPINADCRRSIWGIFDYCDCYIQLGFSFNSVAVSATGSNVTATVDAGDAIAEVNEGNNTKLATIGVTGGIPTMGEWGLILLAVLLLCGGTYLVIHNRQRMQQGLPL